MSESVPSRARGTTIVAVLAAIGGVIGLLAGLSLLVDYLGNAPYPGPSEAESAAAVGFVRTLVVLVVSLAELPFAYATWRQTPWALKPGIRAVGLVAAMILILLGVITRLTDPSPA